MQDQFGNPVSGATPAAVQAYDRAVDAQLHAWPGVQTALDAVFAEAPDFALAQGVQAREVALSALALPGLLPRESSQLSVIASMVHGRTLEALNLLLAYDEACARVHLDACTQDAVRLGGSHAQRDVVEQTRSAMRVPQA